MFGTQFANSQYGTSAEKVLMSIRNAKKRFKDKSIESAVNMEQQNKELMESNKRLEAQLRSFKELLGDKLNVGR